MRISIGGDHAGVKLKEKVVQKLEADGYTIIDHGVFDETPVDFPDVARNVCESVLNGEADRAIMVCGTGVGASIACNKIPGIRASLIHDNYCAHQAVEHDDVQVMCIGQWIIGEKIAFEIIETFLEAKFNATPEHIRRVEKLGKMDQSIA